MPPNDALNQTLLDAVIGNHKAKVKNLLEEGANPNYFEDEAHIQPLHFAALYNSPDVVPLLVMAGANLHSETEYGDTPLMIAERHGHSSMITILQHLSTTLVDHSTKQ